MEQHNVQASSPDSSSDPRSTEAPPTPHLHQLGSDGSASEVMQQPSCTASNIVQTWNFPESVARAVPELIPQSYDGEVGERLQNYEVFRDPAITMSPETRYQPHSIFAFAHTSTQNNGRVPTSRGQGLGEVTQSRDDVHNSHTDNNLDTDVSQMRIEESHPVTHDEELLFAGSEPSENDSGHSVSHNLAPSEDLGSEIDVDLSHDESAQDQQERPGGEESSAELNNEPTMDEDDRELEYQRKYEEDNERFRKTRYDLQYQEPVPEKYIHDYAYRERDPKVFRKVARTIYDYDESGNYDPDARARQRLSKKEGKRRLTGPGNGNFSSSAAGDHLDGDFSSNRKRLKAPATTTYARQSGARLVVVIRYDPEKLLVTDKVQQLGILLDWGNNWPDDGSWNIFTEEPIAEDYDSAEEQVAARRLRKRIEHDHLSMTEQDTVVDPLTDPDKHQQDLRNHPAARGCVSCRRLDVLCPLLDDPTAWPCDLCPSSTENEHPTCQLLVPPKYKQRCQQCKVDDFDCSYSVNPDQPGPCDECVTSSSPCVAGTLPGHERIRASLDKRPIPQSNLFTTVNRKYIQCTCCRLAKKRCSLKHKEDPPPCKRCVKNRTICDFLDVRKRKNGDAMAQEDNSTVKVGAVAEDRHGHMAMMDDEMIHADEKTRMRDIRKDGEESELTEYEVEMTDITHDEKESQDEESRKERQDHSPRDTEKTHFEVSPSPTEVPESPSPSRIADRQPDPVAEISGCNTGIILQDREGHHGVFTKIKTRFAHPMTFSYCAGWDDIASEDMLGLKHPNCHFCQEVIYGLAGLGAAQEVDVIKWNSGLGFTEMGGGFRTNDNSIEPSIMCIKCTMQRAHIVRCEVHEITRIPGAVYLQDPSLNEEAIIRLFDERPLEHEHFCSICTDCAATSRCFRDQDNDYLGHELGQSGWRRGCGLFLCERCRADYKDEIVRGGSFESFIVLSEQKSLDDISFRADVGLLSSRGLVMKDQENL